jgi:hypothetical protein
MSVFDIVQIIIDVVVVGALLFHGHPIQWHRW